MAKKYVAEMKKKLGTYYMHSTSSSISLFHSHNGFHDVCERNAFITPRKCARPTMYFFRLKIQNKEWLDDT